MKTSDVAVVLASFLASGASASYVSPLGRPTLRTIPVRLYAKDCGKLRARAGVQAHHQLRGKSAAVSFRPGAGMNPDGYEPYAKVLKDGFFHADCIKDTMFHHGDKFGNNKFEYTLEDVANVSIVRYSETIPAEDALAITPEVCFEFCRTIPDMMFFGLVHGRECYCSPYYQRMAGDSSMCDSVCEGDAVQMCGGKTKSSIYTMHLCENTAENLAEAEAALVDVQPTLANATGEVAILANDMQLTAASLQQTLGLLGDPVASQLMQEAKIFAGELLHASEEQAKLLPLMDGARSDAQGLVGADFSDYGAASQAKKMITEMNKLAVDAEEATEQMQNYQHLASPDSEYVDAGAQYYSLVYYVDKDYQGYPSTCGGHMIKRPMVNTNYDECAAACDAEVHDCVGFSHYPAGMCFLFSKFTSLTYYTGCPPTSFIQHDKSNATMAGAVELGNTTSIITCAAKLSRFEGTDVKPDPSGKCGQCLKEATKADRCLA